MCEKKFVRFEPDERKELLIRSAIRCLVADGYSGLSVRKIAKEANVSQGLVNHHFGSVNNLISSAYQVLSIDFLQQAKQRINACSGSADRKLDIFFRANFDPDSITPELVKAWLVFWSLVRDSEEMEAAYQHLNNETEQLLAQLLDDINVEERLNLGDSSLAAQSLMALLDGLWLRTCLAERCLPAGNTLKIVRSWVKAYKSGVFC